MAPDTKACTLNSMMMFTWFESDIGEIRRKKNNSTSPLQAYNTDHLRFYTVNGTNVGKCDIKIIFVKYLSWLEEKIVYTFMLFQDGKISYTTILSAN